MAFNGIELPEIDSKEVRVLIGCHVPEAFWVLEERRGSCTELVGHKIARLNRKLFFYLNHNPLVHFLSDRSQQKVKFHYSLFPATPISNVNQKG